MDRGTSRATWLVTVALLFGMPAAGFSQNRGVYPLGMSATGSGMLPASRLTYANQFLAYERGRAIDAQGNVSATGSQFVIMDMNTLTFTGERRVLGGRFAASATVPIARNSLTSDVRGVLGGGSGLADSYYIPVILGWTDGPLNIKAMYGFLAPTGRFVADADDNVGSGYWTHTASSGQTVAFGPDRRLTASAFEMYEVHTTQEGTGTRPGDTFDLDYSLLYGLLRTGSFRLDAGVAGYEQRQTTAHTGSAVDPATEADRYAVNAAGAAVTLSWPQPGIGVVAKFFKEYANRSTFQGYSVQVLGSISF